VAGDVDREVADLERLVCAGVDPPDPGPDPGHQLLGLERLDDVVVGSGLEADHDVDSVALRGQHHDGDAGLVADLLAHVDAVLARQHHVQQYDVGLVVAERVECLVAAKAHAAVEALLTQHDRQHLRQRGVVIDDEHAPLGRQGAGCGLAHALNTASVFSRLGQDRSSAHRSGGPRA
jgi:hypothetical protein